MEVVSYTCGNIWHAIELFFRETPPMQQLFEAHPLISSTAAMHRNGASHFLFVCHTLFPPSILLSLLAPSLVQINPSAKKQTLQSVILNPCKVEHCGFSPCRRSNSWPPEVAVRVHTAYQRRGRLGGSWYHPMVMPRSIRTEVHSWKLNGLQS